MTGIHNLVERPRGTGQASPIEVQDEVRRLMDAGEVGHAEFLAFLRSASPRSWITLDGSMRACSYGRVGRSTSTRWWSKAWRAVRSPGRAPARVLECGIASMERDGHAREAAVRQLALEPDPLAGPFLTLRTIDWIRPVAEAAVSILSERIAREPQLLIASAPLVFALSHRQRSSDVEHIVLARAVADSEARTALLASPDRLTRRNVLSDESVRAALMLDELTKIARTDCDTVMVTMAGVEAVRRSGDTRADAGTLAELLLGPGLLRRAVLDALAERGQGVETGALASRHLFDRSPMVRAAAQRLYRKGTGDPALAYRAALERGDQVPIALTELSNLGDVADHGAILAGLRSSDPATRRAAVSAVRWIDKARLCEWLSPMLWDSSPSVTRAAERQLRARAYDLEGARLWELAASPQCHHRRAAYHLLRRRSAPERIEADLLALAEEVESLRRYARDDLLAWLRNKAASAPRGDRATRRRLSQRLTAVQHQLRDEDAVQLRFHAGLRAQVLEA